MLTSEEEIKSLDVVVSTAELKEFIDQHKEFFFQAPFDESAKVCWDLEQVIHEWLTTQDPAIIQRSLVERRQVVKDLALYTHSTMSSTSNNYLSQVLIQNVFKKTGTLVSETSLVESLRRNKKGFTVCRCKEGSELHNG